MIRFNAGRGEMKTYATIEWPAFLPPFVYSQYNSSSIINLETYSCSGAKLHFGAQDVGQLSLTLVS